MYRLRNHAPGDIPVVERNGWTAQRSHVDVLDDGDVHVLVEVGHELLHDIQ
jgi:hypothetical protein